MMNIEKSLVVCGLCMSMFSLNAFSVGDQPPAFSLPDQDSRVRTLNEFKGKYVVLYFYPKDNTPGCTKQACHLRDTFGEFKKQDIVVLGINYDSPEKHKKFAQKHNLPFILLSDSKKKVAKAYGAKNWWFLPFPRRMTFIIDPQGIICSIISKVNIRKHAAKVLDIIAQHKSGGVEKK